MHTSEASFLKLSEKKNFGKSTTGLKTIFFLSLSLSSSIAATVFHLAGAEETVPIVLNPPNPMEKLDVMLHPPKLKAGIVYCSWSRGLSPETMQEIGIRFHPPINGSLQGPQYTGREDIFQNCSLSISNLTFQDSVNYLLIEGGPGLLIVGYANITVVGMFNTLLLLFSKIFFSLLMICAPKDLMIMWFKDGELYTKESHLLDNNKTLLIPSVTKSDAGGYQCQITNHTSTRISDILNFNVVYGPDTPAIQPTQRYYNEHINVVLTCKADSFPQPRYVWFHNGKEIDTGQKLFLEDFMEDKTGSYICQAGNDLLQKKRNSSSLEIYLEKSEYLSCG
uniref:Ig-like domain-containing protein n=1 Tax=Laticauda laticaudata TaxID=8630 RepID=A0A8C5S0D9_LATLA